MVLFAIITIAPASAYNDYYRSEWVIDDNYKITPYQGINSQDGVCYVEVIKFEPTSGHIGQCNFSVATELACEGMDYLQSLGNFPWLTQKSEIEFRDSILKQAEEHPNWYAVSISMREDAYNKSMKERGSIYFLPEFVSLSEAISTKEYDGNGEKIIRIEVVDLDSFEEPFRMTTSTGGRSNVSILVPSADCVTDDLYVYDIVFLNRVLGLTNIPHSLVEKEIKRQMDEEHSSIILLSSLDFYDFESPAVIEGQGYTITREGEKTRLYITDEALLADNIDLAINQLGEIGGKTYEGDEREAIKSSLELKIIIIKEDEKALEGDFERQADRDSIITELLYESVLEL